MTLQTKPVNRNINTSTFCSFVVRIASGELVTGVTPVELLAASPTNSDGDTCRSQHKVTQATKSIHNDTCKGPRLGGRVGVGVGRRSGLWCGADFACPPGSAWSGLRGRKLRYVGSSGALASAPARHLARNTQMRKAVLAGCSVNFWRSHGDRRQNPSRLSITSSCVNNKRSFHSNTSLWPW